MHDLHGCVSSVNLTTPDRDRVEGLERLGAESMEWAGLFAQFRTVVEMVEIDAWLEAKIRFVTYLCHG